MEKNINLHKKRGKIYFDAKNLISEKEISLQLMQAIFSVFYPIHIQPTHDCNFFDKLEAYGYSEYFDDIAETEIVPVYEMILEVVRNHVKFVRMVKLTKN